VGKKWQRLSETALLLPVNSPQQGEYWQEYGKLATYSLAFKKYTPQYIFQRK